MSSSSKGSARERQIKKEYEAEGWICVRSAASKGAVDIWALQAGYVPQAVQIKANLGSPWMNFRKAEREELREIAAAAGAKPLLIHWPPNGEKRILALRDWPDGPG